MIARSRWAGMAAAALLLVLAACAPAAAPTPAKPASGQAEKPAPAEAKAASGVNIEQLIQLKGAERQRALEAGAKQEGTVVLYTGLIVQEGGKAIKDAFEAKYPGVTLELIRLGGTEMALRTAQEYQAGKYLVDTFEGGSTNLPPLRDSGVLRSFNTASTDDYPAGLKEKNGLWVGTRVQVVELAYNRKLIQDNQVPDTIEGLAALDPGKWKGQLGITGNDFTGGPLFVAATLEAYGQEKGTEILKKMAPLVTPFKSSTKDLMDKVAAGDLAMCVCYGHHTEASKRDGAPVEWVAWKPSPISYGAAALAKTPPHPHAALLFLDWLTAPDGGQLIYQAANYAPGHPKVPSVPANLKERVTQPLYLDTDALAARAKEFTQLYQNIFEK